MVEAPAGAGTQGSEGGIPARFLAMRRRHIRATLAMLGGLPLAFILVFLATFAIPPLWPFFFIGLVMFLLFGGSYLRYTWSCPKCGHYLGQGQFTPGWDITHCRYCGARLR